MRTDSVATAPLPSPPSAQGARPLLLAVVLGASLIATAGAAETAPEQKRDTFEKYNRGMYRFNDGFDRAIAKPVAKGYRRVLPQPVRTGISNFLSNLAYPTTLVNNLLQGKLHNTANDFARIVFNTTIGIGGIFDPATKMGLARNNEDFGQTLGRWGVPSGPYLVLPFLGPSTVRDAPMIYPEYLTNGRELIEKDKVRYSLVALSLVDRRAALLSAEDMLKGAYDPYALIRAAYLQRREYLVRDGNVPASYEEPLEDPGEDETAPGEAPAEAPATGGDTAPTAAAPAATPAPAESAAPPSGGGSADAAGQ